MNKAIVLLLFLSAFYACDNKIEQDEFERINWSARVATINNVDSLVAGKSYLSIYSQIYSLSQHKKYNLTAMASLRNTSEKDTIYLVKADYHGTHGEMIKQYIKRPVYLLPMETLDIVIEESDIAGGTGSNFIFDWKIPKDCPEPIFEAVMSSTVGSQGLSFTTQAIRIN